MNPEPTQAPASPTEHPIRTTRWCVTLASGKEVHFSFTSELISHLRGNDPVMPVTQTTDDVEIVKIELEQVEDVSDVVAFFGTPIHVACCLTGKALESFRALMTR